MLVHEDRRGYGRGGGAETMLRSVMAALQARGHAVAWYWGQAAFPAFLAQCRPDVVHVQTVHTQMGFGPVRWLQEHGHPHVWCLMDYWPFCGNRMLLVGEDRGCEAVDGVCNEQCRHTPCTSLAGPVGRAPYVPLVNRSPVAALNPTTAAIYRRNGLRCDYVLPLGLDHDYFAPQPERRVPGRFLTMSAWPSSRTKGMHVLGKAALRAGVAVGLVTGQPRERVRAILQTAEAFAFPSTYQETWGLCLTEAMATGLACVASAVAGPKAQIEDGVNGLLVPPRDVAALSDALGRLRDPALRARLGAAARETVEAHFTLGHLGERLEAIYEQL